MAQGGQMLRRRGRTVSACGVVGFVALESWPVLPFWGRHDTMVLADAHAHSSSFVFPGVVSNLSRQILLEVLAGSSCSVSV